MRLQRSPKHNDLRPLQQISSEAAGWRLALLELNLKLSAGHDPEGFGRSQGEILQIVSSNEGQEIGHECDEGDKYILC